MITPRLYKSGRLVRGERPRLLSLGFGFCSKCKKALKLSEFFKNSGQLYGIDNFCKQCKTVSQKATRNKKIDHYRAVVRKYHTDNLEREQARGREYYQENKEDYIRRHDERQKRLQDAIPKHLCRDTVNNQYYELWKYCRKLDKIHGIKFSREHIKPIAKGGTHEPSNWTILSLKQNISRNARGEENTICWITDNYKE